MQLSIAPREFKIIAIVILGVATVSAVVYLLFFTNTSTLAVTAIALGFICVDLMTWIGLDGAQSRLRNSLKTGTDSEEASLFAELYQNSPVPYIRTKNNGSIIDVNAAANRLFGETATELVGRNMFAALTGDEATKDHVALIPELVSRGSFVNDQEAIFTRRDGEERWVMFSAFPYARQTETLVTLIDITKQKQVDTAKSEFVSLASHQLRTPIASIKWNIELLGSPHLGSLTDEQRAYVEKVGRSAERMSLLVKDFLDASQLEMGTFATEVEEVSLSEFLADQLEEFEVRIANKQLMIEQAFPPESIHFNVDSHLLRMTVNNLISNAVKYTPDGGRIKISYVVTPETIEIRVRDTGLGIPQADQAKLFSKFFRSEKVKQTLIEGTGIGLYIVKQAVNMMQGAITFASKEDVGTEFLVVLPRSISGSINK